MGGIIGLHCLGDGWLWGARLMQITDAAICLVLELLVLFIWVCLRGRKIAVIEPFIFVLFFGAAGFNLAALQYNLHQMDNNYLLQRDKTGINYVSNNSGSGQLACLALQPRQC